MQQAVNNINDKITYVEKILPKETPTDAATYLGFNDEGKDWYVYSMPFFRDVIAELFHRENIQFYRPTFEADPGQRKSKKTVILKSKILDYVFVPATEEQVIEF